MDDDEYEMTLEEWEWYIKWSNEHFKNYETRDPSMPAYPPPKNKKGRRWTILREKKKEVKKIL